MTIITKSDIEKFKLLVELGIELKNISDLNIYTSDSDKENTYVSLEIRFTANTNVINNKLKAL